MDNREKIRKLENDFRKPKIQIIRISESKTRKKEEEGKHELFKKNIWK